RQKTLDEMLAVIRDFQPDVIVLRWSGTNDDGHGHHQASAILGRDAFPLSGARRMYRVADKGEIAIDTGQFDSVLGESYAEIGGRSRSRHRTQSQGSEEPKGSVIKHLTWVAGERADRDLFDGIDTTWQRFKRGEEVDRALLAAERA